MDINDYLDYFDDDTGQKEEVALIFYYLETEEDIENITQSDVKQTIRSSRSGVPPSNIYTYIRRLQQVGWITAGENDSFLLHHDGEDRVEELLDDEAFNPPRAENERFIDSDVFEDDRYSTLIKDINQSYQYRIYDGTLVLTRKFFENMTFEILREEYAGDNVQMFFDQENQRHYSFDELLNNLKICVPDLKRFTKEGFDREMVEEIRELKEKGNKGAHSVRVDFEDGEVESLSDDATHFAEILYEIWTSVQQANSS